VGVIKFVERAGLREQLFNNTHWLPTLAEHFIRPLCPLMFQFLRS